MPVILTNRTAQLTVNGTDLTQFFVSRENVAEEMLDPQVGLIRITGTLTLRGNHNHRPTLDPELNPTLWAQGNEVIYRVYDSAGIAQIHPAGRLYIRTATHHRNITTVQLECKLATATSENATTDVSGVPIGGQTYLSRTTIAANLLSAVGMAGLLVGTANIWPINYPLAVTGGSIIEQLGQLLASAGYCARQNNQGQIQIHQLNTRPTSVLFAKTVGTNEAEYEPLSGIEAIPSEVWGTSTATWFGTANLNTTLTETSPEGTKTTTKTWNGNVQTIVITDTTSTPPLIKLFQANAATTTTITNIYEADTGATTPDPNNQGRLLKTIETTVSPAAIFFAGLTATPIYETVEQPTDYLYIDSYAYEPGLKFQTRTTRTTTYDSGLFGSTRESLLRQWSLITPSDYWGYREEQQQLYSYYQFAGSTQNTYTGLKPIVRTKEGNDGSTLPPRPETRPTPNPQSTRPVTARIPVRSPAGAYSTKRERTFSWPYLGGASSATDTTPETQLEYLTNLALDLILCRWNGRTLKTELNDALITSYAPLARVDVTDGEVTRQHLLDAPTWNDTPTESSVTFQCLTRQVTYTPSGGSPTVQPPPATPQPLAHTGIWFGNPAADPQPTIAITGIWFGNPAADSPPTQPPTITEAITGFWLGNPAADPPPPTEPAITGIWFGNPATDQPAIVASGTLLFRHYADYKTYAVIGTPNIPSDDTLPLDTEGTQLFSQAIAAADAANEILISGVIKMSQSAVGANMIVTVFAGSTLLDVFPETDGAGTGMLCSIPYFVRHSPGSTASITYSVRVGASTGSLYINGIAAGRRFGGAMGCTFAIQERLA